MRSSRQGRAADYNRRRCQPASGTAPPSCPSVAVSAAPRSSRCPPELPTVAELFTFMRDAERRFETLRMRIEERTFGARGEQLVDDGHRAPAPGPRPRRDDRAAPSAPPAATSCGSPTATSSARSRRRTSSARAGPCATGRGASTRASTPAGRRSTSRSRRCPMETLAELFVHPAGYCQNVLATGECWISGTDRVAGREAIVVECAHPRAVERQRRPARLPRPARGRPPRRDRDPARRIGWRRGDPRRRGRLRRPRRRAAGDHLRLRVPRGHHAPLLTRPRTR